MPRQIQTPDGVIHEFPDEATDAQIQEALSSVAPTPAAASTAQPSFGGQILGAVAKGALGPLADPQGRDILIGAGKSLLGTVEGGGKLIRAIPGVGPALASVGSVPAPMSTEPTNPDQAAGKTAMNVGQFFLPGPSVTKLKTALETGSGVLNALIGAGLEGAAASGVSAVQKGTTEGAGTVGAVTAGTSLAASAATPALRWMGQRIEAALLKPTKGVLAGQTPAELVKKVYKYDLGGSLEQTYDKSGKALDTLGSQLRGVLQADPSARVDMTQVFDDTVNTLREKAPRQFGQNSAIERAIKKLSEETDLARVPKSGLVDLPTAQEIKQGAGESGAWVHQGGVVKVDPDAEATEFVFDTFYNKLKTAIEDTATAGPVKAINKQIGDIMDVRRAAIQRIPIDQRKNVLGLGDLLSFSGRTKWLAIANRILQSGRAANMMVTQPQAIGALATRGAGALTSAAEGPQP